MNDTQKTMNRTPLPIYGAGHAIDITCVVLVFIGMLLGTGFFSNNPGSLIVPFCTLLRSWFGVWAVILSVLTVAGAIAVLLMRWLIPHVTMSRKKQILYCVLFLVVILDGITLSALYGGKEAGGNFGMTIVRFITGADSVGKTSFILSYCFFPFACFSGVRYGCRSFSGNWCGKLLFL